MFKKNYFLILLFILTLLTISSVSATDLNISDDNLSSEIVNNEFLNESSFENDLLSDNIVYFDVSARSDGDGSKSNPYKYVTENTLNTLSGNNITAYFAGGIYELNTPFKITSNVALIGESGENTIFNSILSDEYDFEIMENSNLKLQDMAFNQVNILNHETLEAYNTNFNNSIAFTGENAPLIYNTEKYGSYNGGVINCDPIGDSSPYVYLENCIFNNNTAYCGGAISLKNSHLVVSNSKFYYSYANRTGGVIYAHNSGIIILDSYFNSNVANYGGVIYCEKSTLDLLNTRLLNSFSNSFGGAIASKYSDINVESCNFLYYESFTNAGGAIYNYKGNLNIADSLFYNGFAVHGGVISNLESNLTVYSSAFYDNDAGIGGVIYNIYGKMIIEDNTFYNSNANYGKVITSELSDSVSFINNVFVNSSSNQDSFCICVDSANDIIQYGNHFEETYHVYLELTGFLNGEEFKIGSNILNYVLSNTGRYYGNYEKRYISKNYGNYPSIEIYDYDIPDYDLIFGDYEDYFKLNFTVNNCPENLEDILLSIYVFNDAGYITYNDFLYYEDTDIYGYMVLGFPSVTLFEIDGNTPIVSGYLSSLINSSSSDLNYIPSSYDSRDYGYITPVKNQGEGGNCWAFAGIATLEACIKKITNITYDFSEENVKNMMTAFSILGLDIEPNTKGYDLMVMGYLTNWLGPILEKFDPYDDLSSLSVSSKHDFNVQNIVFLPDWECGLYDDLYKKAIMDYGAISISFYWPSQKGYHAVSIVGWDDNYNNFDSLGEYTKGAWIFKNSWGPNWEDDGFGYLSYDTPFVNTVYTFAFNENDYYTDNYNFIFAGVSDYIVNDGPIYTKKGIIFYESRDLCAFATYFKFPTNYTVKIYCRANGNVLLSQEGHSEAGYHTIPFDKILSMDEGDEVILEIGFCNDGYNYLPVCQADELTKSRLKEGTSLCSFDGGETYFDLYNLEDEYEFYYSPELKSNTCQDFYFHLFANAHYPYLIMINVSEFDNLSVGENININISLSDTGSVFSRTLDTIGLIEGSLVNLKIDGRNYYAMVHDGKASLNISFDKADNYTLNAQYKSTMFESEPVVFNFTVNKLNTNTSLSSIMNNRDSVTLTADLNSSAVSGDVIFTVNGTDYVAEIKDGKATVNLSNLDAGSYVAKATYKGNSRYKISTSSSISFEVEDDEYKVSAPDLTKYYKGSERFVVTVKDKNDNAVVGGEVTINLNGQNYTRTTDSNGQASMAINLNSGIYNVTSEYGGINVKSTITVKSTVSGNNITKIFRNGTQYYATFIDTSGKTLANNTAVEFNINGVFYTRYANEKGVARMNINLNPGEYVITAKNPNSTEMYTNIITVLPSIVENHDLTKYYKNASQYSLRLLDEKGNPVGAGVDIRLNINGVFYTRTSNASGYVNMNINLNPGEYTITAEYNGLMASNTIKVLPVIETKNLVMKYKDGSKFEAKILDGQGKPYSNQTVTFNINGVFYEKVTDKNGIARLAINLMAGEYIITSSYNGLNAANKVTISS